MYWSLLIECLIHISHIKRSLIFFNLNFFSLTYSELITKPIALLSNKVSTVISSYISIFSNPIFTVTFFNNSSPSVFLTFTSLFLFSFFSFFSSFFNLFAIYLHLILFHLFESLCINSFFSLLFLFLQLQAICPKLVQLKHFLFYITLSQFIFIFLHSLSTLFSSFVSSSSCLLFCFSFSYLLSYSLLNHSFSFSLLFFFVSSIFTIATTCFWKLAIIFLFLFT